MKRACVIGWPIEHSRSPLIHNYWLGKYKVEGEYTMASVPPDAVELFLGALGNRGLTGCNVTLPHKEIAFRKAEVRDAAAEAIGAANTLWLDERERLHAANTDAYGYMTYLDERAPQWRKSGGPVSVLGAGGAARAIVHGFLAAGVGEVRVFNRSRGRADELAKKFGAKVKVIDWSERSTASKDAAVIVNATTLGMKGEGSPDVSFAGVNKDCVVSDIVYVPLETKFLKDAREAGLATVDGLGMLLHQAVPGFEKWFGVKPEVTPELRALVVADIEGKK